MSNGIRNMSEKFPFIFLNYLRIFFLPYVSVCVCVGGMFVEFVRPSGYNQAIAEGLSLRRKGKRKRKPHWMLLENSNF